MKKKLKSLVIYIMFPALIIFLGLNGMALFIVPVVLLYFLIFFLLNKENIFSIIAGFHSKRGMNNKALRNIYKAYKVKNSSIDTAISFSYLLLKAGKYDKAGEIIEETLKREMDDTERYSLLSNKGLFLWKKNRITESIELYDELIKNYENTSVYTSYGYVVTLGTDLDKALDVNQKAYEYNSESNGIIDNLGLTYIKMNDLDSALEMYEKLLKRNPNFPEAYFNMSLLMQRKRDIDESVRYMKKCLDYDFDGLSTITKNEVEAKLNYLKRLQGSTL